MENVSIAASNLFELVKGGNIEMVFTLARDKHRGWHVQWSGPVAGMHPAELVGMLNMEASKIMAIAVERVDASAAAAHISKLEKDIQ